MATMMEIRQTAIEPMQRMWQAPKGMDERSLEFQISELEDWCKQRSVAELASAYRWLRENYQFGHWPKIPDWKRAMDASAQTAPGTQAGADKPWERLRKQARGIFASTYARTPLADEMASIGMFREYRAVMVRMIYDALVRGGTGENCLVSTEYLNWLRKRGQIALAATEFRQTEAYQAIHGAPFDFTARYRRSA